MGALAGGIVGGLVGAVFLGITDRWVVILPEVVGLGLSPMRSEAGRLGFSLTF